MHAVLSEEEGAGHTLRLPRDAWSGGRGSSRTFERLPSHGRPLQGSVGSLVQDRVLMRYREVMREEAIRRQHRDGVRRAAVIAAGFIAAASGVVAGYRMTAR